MNNNKLKIIIAVIVIVIVLGVLFYWPRIGKKSVATDVPCLVPNVPLQQHIHPVLKINVDGKPQTVPANVGLGGNCERAVHTHDTAGTIHVEAQDSTEYTLGDFFSVWGEPVRKLGYNLEVKLDGQVYDSLKSQPEDIKFVDKQEIEMNYTK